jgi:hypothetical protein
MEMLHHLLQGLGGVAAASIQMGYRSAGCVQDAVYPSSTAIMHVHLSDIVTWLHCQHVLLQA